MLINCPDCGGSANLFEDKSIFCSNCRPAKSWKFYTPAQLDNIRYFASESCPVCRKKHRNFIPLDCTDYAERSFPEENYPWKWEMIRAYSIKLKESRECR